jgi:putative holliday junction resolvase
MTKPILLRRSALPPPKNPVRGVLLAIDHGPTVLGLAICDAAWIAARPLQLLNRTTRQADFAAINALIEKHAATALVLGMPIAAVSMAAPDAGHSNADTVRRWGSRLAVAVSVPIYVWDEGYSSAEADLLAAESESAPDSRLDHWAAAIILQSFIDAHSEGRPTPAAFTGKLTTPVHDKSPETDLPPVPPDPSP